MANVGTAVSGQVLQGSGNGSSPTFRSLGVNSGLTAHGVVISEGASAFTATSAGTSLQVLTSNGVSADPTFQSISNSGAITTITGDTGSATPSAGNVNIQGGAALSAGTNASVTSGTGSTLTVTSINCAKWIVDPTANRGTHTTITAAIAAASSGQTIFIRPGTYTENLTLKAGVNLTAFECDGTNGNVTIIGQSTASFTGTSVLTGLKLQTNSATVLSVSSVNATVISLTNCYINCTNANGISYTSGSPSSSITLNNCYGDLSGGSLYTMTSAGQLNILYCYFTNIGNNTTSNSNSVGLVQISQSSFFSQFSASVQGSLNIFFSTIDTSALNISALTVIGSGGGSSGRVNLCRILSGTASAITVAAGILFSVLDSIIDSTNTNAISGAGTIVYQNLNFSNTSQKISVTTQTGGLLKGGQTQTPSAGFIGEQSRAVVLSGAPVSVPTGTATNITSISLTAGIWDVSGVITFLPSAITGTAFVGSVSATSAVSGTTGDNRIDGVTAPTALGGVTLTIPSYRVTTTTTISYFLVTFASYTVGTLTACGRISATRVG